MTTKKIISIVALTVFSLLFMVFIVLHSGLIQMTIDLIEERREAREAARLAPEIAEKHERESIRLFLSRWFAMEFVENVPIETESTQRLVCMYNKISLSLDVPTLFLDRGITIDDLFAKPQEVYQYLRNISIASEASRQYNPLLMSNKSHEEFHQWGVERGFWSAEISCICS